MGRRRRTVTATPPEAGTPPEGLDLYALLSEPETLAREIASGAHDGHMGALHGAALSWGATPVLRALRLRRAALANGGE